MSKVLFKLTKVGAEVGLITLHVFIPQIALFLETTLYQLPVRELALFVGVAEVVEDGHRSVWFVRFGLLGYSLVGPRDDIESEGVL